MLCDDVLNSYLYGQGSFLRSLEGRPLEKLLDKIRRAHKFVFEEQTTRLIIDTKNVTPSETLALLDYAKPPYDLTWLEFPQTGYLANEELNAITGKPRTKRLGFLVEKVADDECHISMAYSFKNPVNGPEICLSCLAFKNRRLPKEALDAIYFIGEEIATDSMRDIITDETLYSLRKSKERIAKLSPSEIACAKQTDSMFSNFLHPAFCNFANLVVREKGDIEFGKLIQAANGDWYGESLVVPIAFSFLGCRNVFQTNEVLPPEKLNRARAKRGKEPFFSYHMVDLKPKLRERLEASVGTGVQQRSHWVRGHFKERKTGRFFWHPHLAGNPDLGFVVKDYKA